MRPKKIILLIQRSELERPVMRLVLRVNGFKVMSYSSVAEARQHEGHIDCVLGFAPTRVRDLSELAASLRVRSVLVAPNIPIAPDLHFIDHVLARGQCGMANVLAVIKVAARRRCGPKPGFRRKKPPLGITFADLVAAGQFRAGGKAA
jgi:hypothetical protein